MYDLLLVIIFILAAPKLLYQWVFKKKYRNSFLKRFGIHFPEIFINERKVIWVHAVSVGEVKAVSSLVSQIKKDDPQVLLFLSTITETGFQEAKKSLPEVDHHVFLPFDFLWVVRPIIQKVRPHKVIICETDFWYNFLKCCKEIGAEIYLVNGKISEKSLRRFIQFRRFTRKLFPLIDKYCVQNNCYHDRFLQLGVSKDKIVVTGNLKLDGHYPSLKPDQKKNWKKDLGIDEKDFVLTIGSSHDPEEKLLFNAIIQLWQSIPNVTVLLAPRHPERFDEVAKILEKISIPFNRYSQKVVKPKTIKVILLDTMGILRDCYQLADVAIVAGSYTQRVGGHNIIEPSWYGIPVVYGPYTHAQPELAAYIQEYQAGVQVPIENLTSTLQNLFTEESKRKQIGQNALKMTNELRGALARTWNEVSEKKSGDE